MLTPENVPPVDNNETLSRFILSKRHVNRETHLVKADAFVPHPYQELSVTRDREASENEIWTVGSDIAATRSKELVGRADALAATYVGQGLNAFADPVPGNPNHVNVVGWPADDKPTQKLIAQEIAAVAKFHMTPSELM